MTSKLHRTTTILNYCFIMTGVAIALFVFGCAHEMPLRIEEQTFTVDFVEHCKVRADSGDAEGQALYGVALLNGWGVEENNEAAVEWLDKASKAGNAIGQTYLGGCFYYGSGVETNLTKAIELWNTAADKGSAEAQSCLGTCYYSGEGVEQDYAEAVKWFRKAAEQGNAEAQNRLGACYYNGEGVEQDYTEALKWFRMAVEQENISAQAWIGYCYYNGSGVEKDLAEAVKWYRKAADQGSVPVQSELGACYYNGDGVEQDYAEAVKWFCKAADQGNAEAQFKLGICYYKGQGVAQDYAEAVKWFRKAVEQDHISAQAWMGYCYYNGFGVEKDLAEAVKWYRKAAEQGMAEAQNELGDRYYSGEGVEQDYAEAVKWYRKAAEQGNAEAQFNLGICYHNGKVVALDFAEAVKWFRKSADQDNISAQTWMGHCYYNGLGVKKDPAEAVKWYSKAAEQGRAYAQNELGDCYYSGEGVAQDYAEAVKWFRKAADQGNVEAQRKLGDCYYLGEGGEHDYAEAVKWFRKAAEQGNAVAQFKLGKCYENGEGVAKDEAEAIEWYRKAAEQGHEEAGDFFMARVDKLDEEIIEKLDSDMVPIPGKTYALSKYEVTQALWEAVMGANPSQFKGVDLPVERVSYNGCQKFVEKLNSLLGNGKSGFIYRLPTAQEWKFACLAGATDSFRKLEDGTDVSRESLGEVAWYDDNSNGRTHPVCSKKPNAFGLYDMLGNVSELVQVDVVVNRSCYLGGSWDWDDSLISVYTVSFGDFDSRDCESGLRLARVTVEQAEVERKAATEREEEERKANEEASMDPVAKLAADMVEIPGRAFKMCKYEVAQALWETVMGGNPSFYKSAAYPVEDISWEDCQKFLEKLNAIPTMKDSGFVYRLPTAEEWEFVCRAGSTNDYCKLEDGTEITDETLGDVAWYDENSNDHPHPVGLKKPNAFGIYDMLGNVSELALTHLSESELYESESLLPYVSSEIDEIKWARKDNYGNRVVSKGGSMDDQAPYCLSAHVVKCGHAYQSSSIGVRLVAVKEAQFEAERKATEERTEADRKMIAERRRAAAEKAEAERRAKEEARNATIMKLASDMVPIPGKNYKMCKYEVTKALWVAVMGDDFSSSTSTSPQPFWRNQRGPRNYSPREELPQADFPVDGVSFNDCNVFLEKLNALPKVKESGVVYRLPTADEWEFACLAGSAGRYCKLEDGTEITKDTLDEVAWFEKNSDRKAHSVGQKKSNAFGLYDMLGNVWEWTSTVVGENDDPIVSGGCFKVREDGCNAVSRVNPASSTWFSRSYWSGKPRQPSSKSLSQSRNRDVCDPCVGFRLVVETLQQVEAERKAEEEAANGVLAKLAADMVDIPGKDYAICKYEVTRLLWKVVMEGRPLWAKEADCPVENVTVADCLTFIENLNALPVVKASGFLYRLPMVDEWEFACRAGSSGDYCKLLDGTEMTGESFAEVAWYSENSYGRIHPVGQKKPNAFGLYDMYGNVPEWTSSDSDNWFLCGGGAVDSFWKLGYNFIRYQADNIFLFSNPLNISTPDQRRFKSGFRLARISVVQAEIERQEAANRRKAFEEAARGALAKLATDMVEVPSKYCFISKYEVTQALWFAVTGENPSRFIGAENPVDQVSLDECLKFLEKLNALPTVKATGLTYRLPTVYEWESACLAGATGGLCRLEDGSIVTANSISEVAWYKANSERRTHPVGVKKPNAFGLYDMHGNVREWASVVSGDTRGGTGMHLGGSWAEQPRNLAASFYGKGNPAGNYFGLRLAATTLPQEEAERKSIDEDAKDAIVKLATDMVPIPDKNYEICKYEVTRLLWDVVMHGNASKIVSSDIANLPVQHASLTNCQSFLEKLNALPEVRNSGFTYRLPTADEWEYACRAGATGDYCKLADGTEISKDTLNEVAWHRGNSGYVHQVGLKKPNAFGLYDMLGNVAELTCDLSGADMDYRTEIKGGAAGVAFSRDNRDCGFRLARSLQ